MSLPSYKIFKIKGHNQQDFLEILNVEINLKQPIVIDVKGLDVDEQWNIIKLIDQYFIKHDISFKFPYPIYVLTIHEHGPSNIPLLKNEDELPIYFQKKETRINVKEMSILNKNKLLQRELQNAVSAKTQGNIEEYGHRHRLIHEKEKELNFYKSIYKDLKRKKK